jgi:formamidopyrimidine-DNA glycosylase
MPELPDLQVFSSNLTKELAGKKLEKIQVLKSANIDVPASRLKKTLEGQPLKAVYREGKELRFAFKNKNVLGLHLMLRGKLMWTDTQKPPAHTLLQFNFKGGKRLAVTDFQRKARVSLNPRETGVPDALSKQVTPAFWKEQLQSKAKIKNLLLDQHIVRGIGNAYADEILWQSRISPFSVSSKIPAGKIKALAKSVKQVLTKAEKQVRKAEPGIIGGEVRDFLLIHNPKKKESPTGSAIKKKRSGGRKTYYTDEQELYS